MFLFAKKVPGTQTLKPGWTCVRGVQRIYSTKMPVLKQNTKLRHRTPHGVRRGHPGGRPEPAGRRLSALCGGWLPFEHGFQRFASSGSDGVSWKVGRPLALVTWSDITNRMDNICPSIGLVSKRFAKAPRASPLSSFQPPRAGHACRSRAFAC